MKLKTVHVDFNDSTLGTIAREGEHNRTQLVFVLDEDLQACDFINVEFGIEDSEEKIILENLSPEDGEATLAVALPQAVTVRGMLTIQLVGYVVNSETDMPLIIAKSPVVGGDVTPSINGIKKIAEGAAELLDRILAKLNDLALNSHTHTNAKTLSKFYCESLETGFAFDVSSTQLKWDGKPIRFEGATATISKVEPTVNEEGNNVFRVWLEWGSVAFEAPVEYFDIPVAEVKNTETENSSGLIVNGAELDLGLSESSGSSSLPCVYFDENHHLIFQLGGGITSAAINNRHLEVCIE